MQIHLSRDLLRVWRTLPAEVRRFVELLQVNPRQPDVLLDPDRPDRYEEFVAGYWIVWEVEESEKETIVKVTISE